MSEFKIDKNIPMPKKNRTKYPFDNMNVGDSFFVKLEDSGCSEMSYLQVSLSSTAKYWAVKNKKVEYKFATHKEGDGIRIWRIK